MNKNKIIFYTIWVILLSLGPITVFLNSDLSIVLGNKVLLANFIQRLLGLVGFTLLFIQIILGHYMQRLTEKLGGWVLRFHITQGIITYIIIFLHPVFFVLFNYLYGKPFDPFYVFTQICLLCSSPTEYYYTFGRLAFWFLTVAVTAALFRNATPFMNQHWKKFHYLNYLVVLLVGIHGYSLGTDFISAPFVLFSIPIQFILLYVVVFKEIPKLQSHLNKVFFNTTA